MTICFNLKPLRTLNLKRPYHYRQDAFGFASLALAFSRMVQFRYVGLTFFHYKGQANLCMSKQYFAYFAARYSWKCWNSVVILFLFLPFSEKSRYILLFLRTSDRSTPTEYKCFCKRFLSDVVSFTNLAFICCGYKSIVDKCNSV
jgi:hypothetical protein